MFRWPLPALLAWAACWSLFIVMSRVAAPLPLALVLAAALGLVLALPAATRWRRIFVAAGFPLSLAASGFGAAVPAWAWLLALGALALIYPLNTWRDAPMFPTPAGALQGLARLVPLPPEARVLDAGCGLGDGPPAGVARKKDGFRALARILSVRAANARYPQRTSFHRSADTHTSWIAAVAASGSCPGVGSHVRSPTRSRTKASGSRREANRSAARTSQSGYGSGNLPAARSAWRVA